MKRKVIVVEDDETTIQLVQVILEKEGYEVIGVSGDEALELIAREKPDLIMLDLMMPRINGWQVYKHLKADDQLKSIPVIVLTAIVHEIDRELAWHVARVQGYITKPFTRVELLESIHAVLGDDEA